MPCAALLAAEADAGRGLKDILAAAGASVRGDLPKGRAAAEAHDWLVRTSVPRPFYFANDKDLDLMWRVSVRQSPHSQPPTKDICVPSFCNITACISPSDGHDDQFAPCAQILGNDEPKPAEASWLKVKASKDFLVMSRSGFLNAILTQHLDREAAPSSLQ